MFISAPSGGFTGYEEGTAIYFRGIPYARAERFKMPVPVTFPEGYDAAAFGPKSIQNPQSMMGPVEGPFSEDCLTLNIVMPAVNTTGAPLPVLFDIHGGAFQTGSGRDCGLFTLVTEEEAQLIVVSVNYRLGALGYLYLKDKLGEEYADGNLGMYDQLCALRWVHANIASVGGDPDRITLHGVSAGGIRHGKVNLAVGVTQGVAVLLRHHFFGHGVAGAELCHKNAVVLTVGSEPAVYFQCFFLFHGTLPFFLWILYAI